MVTGTLFVLAGAAFVRFGDGAPPAIEAPQGLMKNFPSVSAPWPRASRPATRDSRSRPHRLVALSDVPQTGHWIESTSPEDGLPAPRAG